MTETQVRIVAELQAAAEKRHARPVHVASSESGVTVHGAVSGTNAWEAILEEYIWNSAGTMLIRVCYLVWEHIIGEDHEWGRFGTQREAEQRIAALFSSASLGSGEYYIARLFTNKPLE